MPARLTSAVRAIVGSAGFFGDRPNALIQELYPGPRTEYVVDTFTHDGIHEVVAISVYDKTVSATGDFVYDRIRWVSAQDAICADLIGYAESVLDALGVRVGPAHMEIMHGGKPGFRLVDFGARAHGAGHPLKTYHLTGTSQVHRECEFAAHTLTESAPFAPKRFGYSLARRGAIVFFSRPSRSLCVQTPDERALESLPGVVEVSVQARAGLTYEATRSFMDSEALGLAFVVADTDEELDQRCETVRAEFGKAFTDAG